MSYEYYANGQKVVLEVDEDLVAVRFTEPTGHSERAAIESNPEVGAFSARFEVPEEKFTIVPVAQTAQPRRERFMAAVDALAEVPTVERVAPVFTVGDSKVIATDRLLIGLKTGRKKAQKFLRAHGLHVIEEFGDGDEFLIQLEPGTDPFAVMDKLHGEDEVAYVEPDFVTLSKHVARSITSPAPADSDPLARDQYAIKITNAVDAWTRQRGSADIKIAILDEGVDTHHEDLAAAIVGNYDATDNDAFQEPNFWDAHGTACAGLAAAVHGNDKGVKGIGGGCSLLAVRIAYSPFSGANYWVVKDAWVRRAIDWSWQNGADVLSNSWGGGPPSNAITRAFDRARTRGRDGKGCVIVIAAGNESGPVSFPGTLPNMLTVSASNEFDEFKTKLSSDGEHWWGSNFGPEVDVAAPGVHNFTTDISGNGGYNVAADGHYVPDFNGTSSATPIVAGAAGLLLSADPTLRESRVREILQETADKVGAEPYVSGRNDQMGCGRLNVFRAVEAARNGNGQGPVTTVPTSQNGSVEPIPLHKQLAGAESLSSAERELLVEQAMILLDDVYVHLPLKQAMHATNPLQRLRLLRHRLPRYSDRAFHSELLSIFTELRDLHTNYLLPDPYRQMRAFLPFLLEEYYDNGRRQYMVSKVAVDFEHPMFTPGVVVTHWNGVPIDRAVELNADRNAGSNEHARHARGLERMTMRPLILSLPPDEEWVDVRYLVDGEPQELQFIWQGLPVTSTISDIFDANVAELRSTLALDIETEIARHMKKALFAPKAMAVEKKVEQYKAEVAAMGDAQAEVAFDQVSLMPDNFSFRTIQTPQGELGYVRIYTFMYRRPEEQLDFANRFVQEFARILALLPPNGLIVDVRGNGGGIITAGEKILQLLTAEPIEPEPLHFINTPLMLELCRNVSWLSPWVNSIRLSTETGAVFSQGFPLESSEAYNQLGQRYFGPVVLITDALCYSTTDIFAAGFQDHAIGPILGVGGNTGAGGANVWTHDTLRDYLPTGSALKPLPKNAGFRVSIRRTTRVGANAGLPLEDLGVAPDEIHQMTQDDLLHDNVDLIEKAVSLLER